MPNGNGTGSGSGGKLTEIASRKMTSIPRSARIGARSGAPRSTSGRTATRALTASSRKSCKGLLRADVQHAALLVLLVHAHHHAVRVEAYALALGERVLHPLCTHDAGVIGLLHRRANLLLVGRAGAPDGIGDQHDAV